MRASSVTALVLVFGLGIASALIAGGGAGREQRAAAASATDVGGAPVPSGELAALRAELAALRAEVSALRRPAAGSVTSADAPLPQHRAQLREEIMRNVEAHDVIAQQRSKAIKARLDAELGSFDPEWSKDYASRLRGVLAQPELRGAKVTDLRCGSRVCKVSTKHAGLEAAESFEGLLTLVAPDSGGAWSQPTLAEDGSAVSVVYLARKDNSREFQAALREEQRRAIDAVVFGEDTAEPASAAR